MIPFLDSVVVTPEGDVKSAAAAKEPEKAAKAASAR